MKKKNIPFNDVSFDAQVKVLLIESKLGGFIPYL